MRRRHLSGRFITQDTSRRLIVCKGLIAVRNVQQRPELGVRAPGNVGRNPVMTQRAVAPHGR